MKAKGAKFPLSLSSLENKLTHNKNTRSGFELIVVAPQTATQNARQHVIKHATKSVVPRTKLETVVTKVVTIANLPKPNLSCEPVMQAKSEQYIAGPARAMVARLEAQGIEDQSVLAVMGAMPRHLFVEPALSGQAYVDTALPIGHQQTISQPYIVARMIEAMRNGRKLDNVLEIGTGCGYQAAVLAQLSQRVYSIERIKSLHELAKKNLRPLRIANLRLHYGDGMHGLPQVGPFDGIILAAAGIQIPNELLQQLAIGGRLVAPVFASKGKNQQQILHLIERTGNADWTEVKLEECYFVPLCSGTI